MLKRILFGGLVLLCAALSGQVLAQTAASYKNSNGSFSNSSVQLCSTDGVNTIPCPGTSATSPSFIASAPTPNPVVSAQQTCTTSAAALSSQAYSNGFFVTALTTNSSTVYVGGAGVTTNAGYPLVPGQSSAYNAANSNQASIICLNTTDKVAITGN